MNRRMYPRLMLWPVLLGLVLLVGPAWGQAVVYVDAGASGAGDGSSWADAFTSVQAGLDAAAAGDQVWVAAGRYVENITLVDGVALHGGFAGDEDPETFDLAERDFGVNEMILDGDEAGSVVTAVDLADEATRIDGFTITNGQAEEGGGLYLYNSSPTIANNVIRGNSADELGGGLCLAYSSPTIVSNTITRNIAYSRDLYGHYSGEGGGLCLLSASPTITNNAITGNRAFSGGGAHVRESSSTIANNTITGNSAYYHGGGLSLEESQSIIVNNMITCNSGPLGGAMSLYASSPTIANNTIAGNSARDGGGGLHLFDSYPTIANTIIAFNSSGVYLYHGDLPVLKHNCVYGNAEYDYSGLDDPTGTEGNISADPLFADPPYGNWHIQPDSPCIETGANDCVSGEFDIDGEPRIQPADGTVDIGADESDGTLWPTGAYVIVRVSPHGDDGNDGSSWALAKRTVQAAIDVASELGGEVWVAGGTYYERIWLLPCAYVYGGFGGSESERSQRDWASNVTVLDGQRAGSVVTAYVGQGVSTLDGFTVTNGHAEDGGGLHLQLSSPTIANNTITGNSAEEFGGGLYLSDSSPTIANNTIAGNIACGDEYYGSYYSGEGGGLCLWRSSPTIMNNKITDNAALAEYGFGGGLCLKSSAATIANNTIARNRAWYGGGLYLSLSSPTITDNVIAGNTGSGGGLCLSGSSGTITKNRITGNSGNMQGGGLRLSQSSPTIANNTISGNRIRWGGGLYLSESSPTIVNNTVAGNSAGDEGGGLYLQHSSPTIANTIVAFNSSGVCVTGTDEPLLSHNCVYGNAVYDYSGMDDPTGTGGSIAEDPLFADRAYGNWHIQPNSPCVDVGDNDYVFGEFDIDGEPRIHPAGGTVDIGADESGGTVWPVGPCAIVRVSPDGDDGNDGSCWSLAKQTVQAAIDVVAQFGGEVWVAAGSYYERITLLPYAHVYGGFSGFESERNERDWVSNVTVLDGQQAGSVVTAHAGQGVSTLNGFTVTNGRAENGGGLWLYYSSPTIANNTITGNGVTWYGGGLYLNHSSATIANNTITDNSARSCGGLCVVYSSSPTITNNTIAGNGAIYSGGGVCLGGSSPTLANTIIAFNSSGVRRSGEDGTPILRHNCVYGNSEYDYSGMDDPTGTDGNMLEDPLFVVTPGPGPDGEWGTEDDELGDLRLLAGSPCIDAGDNAYVPEFVTTDLEGNPRFVDGSGDGVATVDMGAYEYQFRPGDLNCDGAVDVFDIDPFVLALTSAIDEPPFAGYLAAYPDCDPRLADVNGDGLVNVFDIDPFVQLLTGGPLGACCMGDGCQVLQQAACMAAGGWLWLAGQGCEPDPCPPPEPPGMVLIPAGEFMMGDTFGEGSYETPVHAVYVDAFYMGRYEVTKGLWDSVRAWGLANGYGMYAGAGKGANYPVTNVNWFDCVKWCNARSEMEGRTPVYYTDADLTTVYRTGQLAPHVKWDANGYRLPTEAEWEKAARGGTPGHRFPWSDQDTIQHARCNYRSSASYSYDTSLTRGHHPCWGVGSQPYTSPVGFFDGSMQYKADWGWPGDATSYQTASGANGYGLYDVAGNVWEWCHDWYSDTYYGSSPYDNPTGPASGTYRLLRGGSWYYNAYMCRVAYRYGNYPDYRYSSYGFRLALDFP